MECESIDRGGLEWVELNLSCEISNPKCQPTNQTNTEINTDKRFFLYDIITVSSCCDCRLNCRFAG